MRISDSWAHSRSRADQKASIFFPRTYRRLPTNRLRQLLFLALVPLPFLVALLVCYPFVTERLSQFAILVLSSTMPTGAFSLGQSDWLPFLGHIKVLTVTPTHLPSLAFTIANLAVTVALILACCLNKRRKQPIFIYLVMNLLVHLASCLFFLIAPWAFPYTVSSFAELYMLQQLCVWISFSVIAGVAIGLLTAESLPFKAVSFLAIMAYSLIFGTVRYIFFIWVLQSFTIIYMPILFFALGPFYDFLYLVFIYGLITDHMVEGLNKVSGQSRWQWF